MPLFNFKKQTEETLAQLLAQYYIDGVPLSKHIKNALKRVKPENFKSVITECNFLKHSKQTLKSQKIMRNNKRATGYAPIGYKNILHRNREADVVLEKKVAKQIKELFNHCKKGCTIDLLVLYAKKCGLVGKKSKKPLTKQAILYILSNPFYCGYARHKGKTYKHRYKALISEKDFNKCQDILQRLGYIKSMNNKKLLSCFSAITM